MKDEDSNERWATITSREAADTLTDPAKRRYLEPFIRRERTLTQAARDLGLAPTTLLYQVRRLQRLGLLRVVRREPRRGRASPVYRASAERFFVPFESTSAATIEELLFDFEVVTLKSIIRGFTRALSRRAERWGLGLGLAADGKLEFDVLPQHDKGWRSKARQATDDHPALLHDYLTVALTDADAKAVQRAMIALELDVRGRDAPEEGAYLLHLAIIPLDEHE